MITWRLTLVFIVTGTIMWFVDNFSDIWKTASILLILVMTLWAADKDSQNTREKNNAS